ncbi:resolvase [Methylobacterium terricola]|uniref:Resolvase n=1 Tax=Methylobacterium terricola TaxID=2583531 RepID=A0A5C4L6H2_9HYPH|nr:recombinase family protein [Methylobacterium terricola]TNC06535.1 resolvase [Methylobacterium terricola]
MKVGFDSFADKGRATSIWVRQERAKQQAVDLAPIIDEIRAEGATTLQAIADALSDRGLTASRGGRWTPTAVKRVLSRMPE